ncbi:MAG: hypothetical protein WC666_04065 [Candidatus Paceibacterota bacterium]|jgi:hypothetical protein
MKKIYAMVIFGMVVLLNGCVTKKNVTYRGPTGETFNDKSWSVNQPFAGTSSSGNYRIFSGGFQIGGGPPPPPVYYNNGYSYGGGYYYGSTPYYTTPYPMITVPIESERHYRNQTMQRYGLKK